MSRQYSHHHQDHGYKQTKGGLQPREERNVSEPQRSREISNKSTIENEKSQLKGKSILGLDRLAAERRLENKDKPRNFNRNNDSYKNESYLGHRQQKQPMKEPKHSHHRQRQYRRVADETPSHPGGVNSNALRLMKQREWERKNRRKRGRDYDQDRDQDRDRDRDRNHQSSYRNRNNDVRRHHDSYKQKQNHNARSQHILDKQKYSSNQHNDDQNHRLNQTLSYSDKSKNRYNMNPNATPRPVSLSSSSSKSGSMSSTSGATDKSSSWDVETPLLPSHINSKSSSSRKYFLSSSRKMELGESTPLLHSQSNKNNEYSIVNTSDNEEDAEFDRQFYLADDDVPFIMDSTSSNNDDTFENNRFLFTNDKIRQRELDMQKKRDSGNNRGRMSKNNARKSALLDDQEKWEENRLLSSGAAIQGNVSLEISNDDDVRVTLLVHQVKPPFLDGRASFSTIQDAVPTVRDASSDFAKMAREGSDTLRRLRENKDKNAMRQRFWELGGSKMGDAMGVKKKNEIPVDGQEGIKNKNEEEQSSNADQTVDSQQKARNDDVDENGEINYKKSTGYAQHMNKKSKNDSRVSEFAKTKTIRQQREFLPAFTIRDELLNVIRENTVVIVVGETGSGKTTQLTQVRLETKYFNNKVVHMCFILQIVY